MPFLSSVGRFGFVVNAAKAFISSITLALSGTNSDVYLAKYDTSGNIQWATRIYGLNTYEGTPFPASDTNGNVYILGIYISNPVTILNANTTTFKTLNTSNTNIQALFVVKYDSAGTGQWAARITGAGNNNPVSISTDSSGNVYVSGRAALASGQTIDIRSANDVIFTSISPTSINNNTSFLAKYNSTGTVVWAVKLASTSATQATHAVTDSAGNTYIAVNYLGTLTITNADGSTYTTLSGSSTVAYGVVIKYNTSGVVQGYILATSPSSNGLGTLSVAVDSSSNIYVTGSYGNAVPVTIGGMTGSTTLTPANASDVNIFVAKFTSAIAFSWAGRIEGLGTDINTRIAVDTSGNVFVAGEYNSKPLTIYNPSSGTSSFTLTYSGNLGDSYKDIFLVKYDTSGTPQWGLRAGSATGTDVAPDIAADGSGNAYLVGTYDRGLPVYNSGGTVVFATIPSNDTAIHSFIVKFNSTGTGQWYARLGAGSTSQSDSVRIAFDPTGNIIVAGAYYTGSVTLYSNGL